MMAVAVAILFALSAAVAHGDEMGQTLVVTATAYNSVPEQTGEDPNTGAWGDDLRLGLKAIAVSRDLIPFGLTRRVPVQIEGMKNGRNERGPVSWEGVGPFRPSWFYFRR